MKVTITKDAEKLWKCAGMRLNSPKGVEGKLPSASGKQITICLPGMKSHYCDGWKWMVTDDSLQYSRTAQQMASVCEHQIDFPSEEAERIAKEVEG